ncbi:MAG: FtsX-like permease family protein [Deltaproteobacteria bacterium]|nr:FtsX-like permease family protein [Deltaproteobacteria bacterium]
MKSIHLKLLRDLTHMWAQVLTVALVVASGVGTYVAAISTWSSLVSSRDSFYQEARFADVFARVKRAPERVLDELRALPGVERVEGRIFETFRLELPGVDEPTRGGFVSLPRGARPLNRIHLRSGYFPQRDDEVLVSELFAKERALRVGSRVDAIAYGQRVRLRISGVAVSPEYLWVMEEGSFLGDNRRYGVFWMNHEPLATLTGFEGAFNDLVIGVLPNQPSAAVVAEVDRALDPWGSFGAVDRSKQTSNRLVSQEIDQLRGSATVLPTIFLAVGAFLVNILLSRVVQLQREQIAALKALGYRNREIGAHYLQLALAMALPGSLLGIGLGAWLGGIFVEMYEDYFRFPVLALELDPKIVVSAVLMSLVSAIVGALFAVRRAVTLAPAQAMRPEAPLNYRPTFMERMGIHALLPVSVRMVLRDLERQPVRSSLSAIGIALSTSIVVAGYGAFDSFALLFQLQFERIQTEDLSVTFFRPMPPSVLGRLSRLEGVTRVEGQRAVGLRLRNGHLSRETGLMVVPSDLTLRKRIDASGESVELAAGGLSISAALAEALELRPGDFVEAELLGVFRPRSHARTGTFQKHLVQVNGIVEDFLGLSAYVDEEAFTRLTAEPRLYSEVYLDVDPSRLDEVVRTISSYPSVLGVLQPAHARDLVRKQVTELVSSYQVVLAVLSMVLAIGVVYNNARISLVTRSRDFATLRILGFTRLEVRRVLIGEQVVQLLLGIPFGVWLGRWLVELSIGSADPELFRLPLDILPVTYVFAALVVLTAGVGSAAFVGRKLRNMDLVAVLKARD